MFSLSGKNGARNRLFLVLTNIISLACLIWVLHDIDLGSLVDDIADMEWGWVIVAAFADVAVYVWQGYRWSLLLTPVERVPVWRSVRAIYVGLFANEVLPFRSGELIRCYLQSRWSHLPFTVTLSSALIERIFDGIWLMFCLFLTVRFVPLPKYLVDGGLILAVLIAIAALLLGLVMFWKHHAHAVLSGRKWLRNVQILVDDLHAIGNSPFFYIAFAASLPFLLLQIIPIWTLLQGYGLELHPGHAFVVLVILRLGTAIPQAPGNIGTFQALAAVALVLLGVEPGLAKRFSLIMWAVVTLPLLFAGFIALAVTGVRLADVKRQAAGVAREVESEI